MTNGEKLFLILAEELSFGRAAKRCFLSQQCFSDHIKRLEEYYGTTLFTRRPSIELTAAGRAVQRTLMIVSNLEQGLASELSEIENGASGTLRIGINYTRAKLLVPPFFQWCRFKYPNVKIELTLEETVTMQVLLEKGKLDCFLGINAVTSPMMQTMTMAYENIYLMASSEFLRNYPKIEPRNLINRRSEADLQKFRGVPFAMNYGKSTTFKLLNQYMADNNITVNNVLSVSDYDVSEKICRSGYAASFCPQIFIPTILKGNRTCEKEEYIYALPVKGLNRPLRFDLILNESIHYPRFAFDCFGSIRKIVRDYLAETDAVC